MTMRWNRSRCVPRAWASAALIGSAWETHTIVPPRMGVAQPVERGDHAVLHLGEALAAGEAERRRRPLHRAPLGLLHQPCSSAPVQSPKSHSSRPRSTCGRTPVACGDRRRRLPRPLERRRVDRVDAVELADPLRGPLGLLRGRRRRGAARRPGRAAPCRSSASGRGGRAGSSSARGGLLAEVAIDRMLNLTVGVAMDRSGYVGVTTLAALEADVVDCRRCPRLVAWREQVAVEKRAAFRDEAYWGRPVPGFGDPQRADRRARAGAGGARRQPHRPGVHRRPQRRLAVPGDAPGRPGQPADVDVHAGDGLRLHGAWVTARGEVRAAGQPADARPSATRARRSSQRELDALDAGGRRVPRRVRLRRGVPALRRAAPPDGSATASRSASTASRRCCARSTRASRTRSPAGSPSRCSTPCSPGLSS